MSKRTKVLFIHGLEGHPQGSKVLAMRAQGFRVHCADMKMSKFNLLKRNSILRSLLRLPEVRLGALGALALPILGAKFDMFWPAMGLCAGGTIAMASVSQRFMGRACMESLEACVELNRRAIAGFRPDVIVGSSWGGAVASELVRRRHWRGPVVFLAPAYVKVLAAGGAPDTLERLEELRRLSARQPMVILHDRKDDVIPFEHSEVLARGSSIQLKSVNAGGHRLLGLLEDGRLRDAIHAIHAKAPSCEHPLNWSKS
jgi:hypothetical protein